ncbi:MAG: carboxypeptidase-like regulatory domain-containing protein, partial [Flavobacteriaceae bacterium]|nr:carboxypeptidase-like regulatory domain-containing protein [Flavobacteriaceae bacterium]
MMISYILKKKSLGLAIILFCLSLVLFSQENRLLPKEIRGKVTHLNAPLPNVNIILKGTTTGTKTDAQGYYTIKAKIADV